MLQTNGMPFSAAPPPVKMQIPADRSLPGSALFRNTVSVEDGQNATVAIQNRLPDKSKVRHIMPGGLAFFKGNRAFQHTATVNTACYSYGAGAHSWQWTAQGKSAIAHKGMIFAAKVMAESAKTLLEHPEEIKKAWNEFDKRLDGEKYECLIPKEIEPHVIE